MGDIRSYKDLSKISPVEFENIVDALRKSILESANPDDDGEEREQRKYRLDYLSVIKQKFLQLPSSRSVFISYTASGKDIFLRAKDFFEEQNYKVNSGFAPDRKGDLITENIIDFIERSRFFLAIWSKEYFVSGSVGQGLFGNPKAEEEKGAWIPSMWMPFELAAAMTLRKCMAITWVKDEKIGPHSDVFTRMLGDFTRDEISLETAKQVLSQVYDKFEQDLRNRRPFQS
ncbi:MAG TPA: hypothetical protein VII56_21995 [Rhizomicrobium sp.]